MHEGHRQRMMQRLEIGEETLRDHEILEILLFNAIPRKNTNGIAHELLLAFGSLEAVLRADFAELKCVKGVGAETAAYLRCIGLCYRQKKSSSEAFPQGLSLSTIQKYLVNRYDGLTNEVLEIFCVDGHSKITHCQRFTDFSNTQASVDIDQLNKLLAAHRPSGFLIAHNHPTASCRSSESDDRFTLQLSLYCNVNHIKILDHIIVGQDGIYSYYKEGLIDEYREKCSVQNILTEKLNDKK